MLNVYSTYFDTKYILDSKSENDICCWTVTKSVNQGRPFALIGEGCEANGVYLTLN